MSKLQTRLEAINALPRKNDRQFEAWLEQRDVLEFLEQNAEESEFVILPR